MAIYSLFNWCFSLLMMLADDGCSISHELKLVAIYPNLLNTQAAETCNPFVPAFFGQFSKVDNLIGLIDNFNAKDCFQIGRASCRERV